MSDIHESGEEELKQEEQAAKAADAEPVVEPEVKDPEAKEPEKVLEKPEVPQVPIHALHEARAEISQLKAQNQKFEGLYEDVQEWRQSQKVGQENEAFNADPLGTMYKNLSADIASLKKDQDDRNTVTDQREQSQAEMAQLRTAVEFQVNEFVGKNPDYEKAREYVMENRAAELALLGTPPHMIAESLDKEAVNLAAGAVNRGENPAEVLYNYAKLRGYVPGKAPKADVGEQIAALAKGQDNSQQLPAGAEDKVGLLEVSNMTDPEFEELWAEMELSNKGSQI